MERCQRKLQSKTLENAKHKYSSRTVQECRQVWHKRVLLHVKHVAVSSGKKQVEARRVCKLVRHFLSLLDVGGRGDLCGGVSGMWEVAGRAGVGLTPWSKVAWKEGLRANW